jgi:hypothetical protein
MTVWAKVSTPATAMACAACIATAATLPVMGTAAEKLANTAAVKLSASLADIDAFSVLGATSLTDIAALGALGAPVIGTAALDAVPAYLAALGGDPSALTDIAAVSSLGATSLTDIDAFSALGAPFIGTDAFGAAPNIVNSLGGDVSRASGLSGIDAFSGLPAINAVLGHLEIGALAPSPNPDPTGDPIGGIAAFSAIPSYLGIDPPAVAPDIPWVQPPDRGTETEDPGVTTASTLAVPTTGSAPTTGANALRVPAAFSALVPQPNAAPAPAPVDEKQQVTPVDNSGADSQNIVRDSQKFTPGSSGNSPILFGTANRGVENGMPGWQAGLKSLGLAPSGATPGGATPGGATPGGATSGTGQGAG